jgi:hypothetical protein
MNSIAKGQNGIIQVILLAAVHKTERYAYIWKTVVHGGKSWLEKNTISK